MYAARAAPMPPHPRRDVLHLPKQHGANLIEMHQIHAERLFLADALGVAVGGDITRVFAVSQAEGALAGVAKTFLQPFEPDASQIADGAKAGSLELFCGLGPNSPD